VIEPLFEAHFLPCSFGFRPKKTPRMAPSTIIQSVNEGRSFVVDVDRGSPQGGVISPLLSNIFLHEVDRQWCRGNEEASGRTQLVRYADDIVLLARTEQEARTAWKQLQAQFCGAWTGSEPGQEQADDASGRVRVSGL